MGARLYIRGVIEMRDRIRRIARNAPEEFRHAAESEMLIDLLEVDRRTPFLTGKLRSTNTIDGPYVRSQKIVGRIVSGGPSAPYGVAVHERIDVFHPIGQAKYLESVWYESRPFMAGRIARRIELQRLLA